MAELFRYLPILLPWKKVHGSTFIVARARNLKPCQNRQQYKIQGKNMDANKVEVLCVKYENSRLYLKRESLYLLQVSMRS